MFVGLRMLWVPGAELIAEQENPVVKAAKKLSKTKMGLIAATGLAVVGAVATVVTFAATSTATGAAAATGAIGVETGYGENQLTFQTAIYT